MRAIAVARRILRPGSLTLPARSSSRVGVLVGLALFVASQAHAVTLVVDTTTDTTGLVDCSAAPDDCSLRGALIRTNFSPGADVIPSKVAWQNQHARTSLHHRVIDRDRSHRRDEPAEVRRRP